MTLGIYTEASIDTELSANGEFTNPLAVTFDGRSGGIKEIRLYVHNIDPSYYYTDVTLTVVDNGINNIVNSEEDGYSWKLSAGDSQPTAADWANIAPANTISLDDLGSVGNPDSSTYLPFWIRVQVPPGLDVQVFDSVQFVLTSDRNLI